MYQRMKVRCLRISSRFMLARFVVARVMTNCCLNVRLVEGHLGCVQKLRLAFGLYGFGVFATGIHAIALYS